MSWDGIRNLNERSIYLPSPLLYFTDKRNNCILELSKEIIEHFGADTPFEFIQPKIIVGKAGILVLGKLLGIFDQFCKIGLKKGIVIRDLSLLPYAL